MGWPPRLGSKHYALTKQCSKMDMDALTAIVSTLGVSGVLVWYLYYTTAVTIPKRDEIYTASVERIANNFADTLREERQHRELEINELKEFIAQTPICRYNRDHGGA